MSDLPSSLSSLSLTGPTPTFPILLQQWHEDWAHLDTARQSQNPVTWIKSSKTLEKRLLAFLSPTNPVPTLSDCHTLVRSVILVVLSENRLSLEYSQLFSLKIRALDVFLGLVDIFEEEVGFFKEILDFVMKMWADFQDFEKKGPGGPGKGKAGKRGGRSGGRGANASDLWDEPMENAYTDQALSLTQLSVLLFTKSNQYFLLLSVLDKRAFASVANSLWVLALKLLPLHSLQVQIGVSELIAQLAMLSLRPFHLKIWEELRKEEEKEEEDFEGEENDSENLSTLVGYKDDDFYEGYPFYKPTIGFEEITEINTRLLGLCVKTQEDTDLGLSSLVGVFCGFAAEHYPIDRHVKFVEETLNSVMKQIEILPAKNALGKVIHFQTLAHVMAFSQSMAIAPHFQRIVNLIETTEETTRKWARGEMQQPPAGKGGRKGGRGKESASARVDPQNEKDYEILKAKLSHAFAMLSYKAGSSNLLSYAKKFFTTTIDIFKANSLILDFLIALSQTLLTPEANSHQERTYCQSQIAQFLPKLYNEAVESAKNSFNLPKIKKDAVLFITKVSTAHTSQLSTTPLFPNFLPATLGCLIEVLNKDAYQIGPSVIVSIQKLLLSNRNARALHESLLTIINSVTKYLEVEDDEKELLIFLKLASLDTLELIFKQVEFKPYVQDAAKRLVPSIVNTLKKSAILAKEEANHLAMLDVIDSDDELDDHHDHTNCSHGHSHKHSHIHPQGHGFGRHLSDSDTDHNKKEKSPPPLPVTKEELSNFKFDFGNNNTSESGGFKFDFGAPPKASEFKFDFGAKPSPSPFQFSFPTTSDTPAFKFDLGSSAVPSAPLMSTNPDGESNVPAFTFGAGRGVKVAGEEGVGSFNFPGKEGRGKGKKGKQESHMDVVEKKDEPVPQAQRGRGRGKVKGGRGSAQPSPAPIPEPTTHVTRGRGGKGRGGRASAKASPAPIPEPSTASGRAGRGGKVESPAPKPEEKQTKQKGSVLGTGKSKNQHNDDDMPELVEDSMSDDDEDFSIDDEELEFSQLCIAAVDASVAMLGILAEEPMVGGMLMEETKAALSVLDSIPQLEKSDLRKRQEKLKLFENRLKQ